MDSTGFEEKNGSAIKVSWVCGTSDRGQSEGARATKAYSQGGYLCAEVTGHSRNAVGATGAD